MKITTVYLPICLGFILSRAWRNEDNLLLMITVIAFILDIMLVMRGATE